MSIIVTWVENGSTDVVPSAMSKAGIEVMTKSLAIEWARYGIRLNAVGPGEIPTEGMSKRLNPGEEPALRLWREGVHGILSDDPRLILAAQRAPRSERSLPCPCSHSPARSP